MSFGTFICLFYQFHLLLPLAPLHQVFPSSAFSNSHFLLNSVCKQTEDEVVGWHPRLNKETAGDREGVGSLACCSPWRCREMGRTWQLNNSTEAMRFSSVQFSSDAQPCPTLCDPMNCSTPGLPVHHQLLKLAHTHVHQVSDAIQPSHPLLSPSPPAFKGHEVSFSKEVIKSLSLKGLPIPWHFDEMFSKPQT